jgi:hypothetical protein
LAVSTLGIETPQQRRRRSLFPYGTLSRSSALIGILRDLLYDEAGFASLITLLLNLDRDAVLLGVLRHSPNRLELTNDALERLTVGWSMQSRRSLFRRSNEVLG